MVTMTFDDAQQYLIKAHPGAVVQQFAWGRGICTDLWVRGISVEFGGEFNVALLPMRGDDYGPVCALVDDWLKSIAKT